MPDLEWHSTKKFQQELFDGKHPQLEDETDRIFNGPGRIDKFTGLDRSRKQIWNTCFWGKVGELFAADMFGGLVLADDHTYIQYGKQNPRFGQVNSNYIDLIRTATGSYIEVKFWREDLCRDYNSTGWLDLFRSVREGWSAADYIIILGHKNSKQKVRFDKTYKTKDMV